MLDVRGLSRRFRGLEALADFDLQLPAGTIHGVIGPNGAGKTTLFNVLSGFLRPSRGTVRFKGSDLTGAAAYAVSRLGIARTFQNIRLFGDLPVIDNVKVGLHRDVRRSLAGTLLSTPAFRKTERELTERSMEILRRFGSTSTAIAWPATCHTGTSGASRSPGRSRPIRRCSSWTSRMPA